MTSRRRRRMPQQTSRVTSSTRASTPSRFRRPPRSAPPNWRLPPCGRPPSSGLAPRCWSRAPAAASAAASRPGSRARPCRRSLSPETAGRSRGPWRARCRHQQRSRRCPCAARVKCGRHLSPCRRRRRIVSAALQLRRLRRSGSWRARRPPAPSSGHGRPTRPGGFWPSRRLRWRQHPPSPHRLHRQQSRPPSSRAAPPACAAGSVCRLPLPSCCRATPRPPHRCRQRPSPGRASWSHARPPRRSPPGPAALVLACPTPLPSATRHHPWYRRCCFPVQRPQRHLPARRVPRGAARPKATSRLDPAREAARRQGRPGRTMSQRARRLDFRWRAQSLRGLLRAQHRRRTLFGRSSSAVTAALGTLRRFQAALRSHVVHSGGGRPPYPPRLAISAAVLLERPAVRLPGRRASRRWSWTSAAVPRPPARASSSRRAPGISPALASCRPSTARRSRPARWVP
mmetsp:Transcript_57207/g.179173  ORF Transcript_57207/g.179173 Transcript_57207/m.179173 type:complete len:457 (-) Transcript_57207:148-1518(-)